MLGELQTHAEELRRDGKLDKTLKRRLRFFEALSFVFGLITAYDILIEGFPWFPVILTVAASFLFGFVVLSKINKVSWDRRRQAMVAQKIDIFGVAILVMYVGGRIAIDGYLRDFFNGSTADVLAYTFFTIFGVTLGRFVGLLASIYLARPKSHHRSRFTKRKR